MAHKTLIGGTAYEISGGKTFVDGTAYSIKNGQTLVDGTVYEMGFEKVLSVTVMPPDAAIGEVHNAEYARVTINGAVYDGSETIEIEVKAGTVIQCYAYGEGTGLHAAQIFVDGIKVASGAGVTYDYEVTSDCKITVYASAITSFGTTITTGSISITTET